MTHPEAAQPMASTPLHHLARALRRRASTPSSEDAPVAILWTDPRREWHRLIPAALRLIPELLVLGDYRPDERAGPAIWLRCVVDRATGVPGLPDDVPPILYLPGVERGQLRAGEECPDEVKPLVELMYRGVLWHHPNGKSWSVRAFLMSPGGPELDIARDGGTTEALRGALDHVATTPMDQLGRGRLDAEDFNRMTGVQVERDILRWMGDPKGMRAGLDADAWRAFRSECRGKLDFDPGRDADVSAGALLAKAQGRWASAWSRFAEAPAAFPGVPEVLARSRPGGVLALERERWPDLNDEDEQTVRETLAALPRIAHGEACRKVIELEKDHGPRRGWVWARLNGSPMAVVLEPLARLAAAAEKAIGGRSPEDIAQVYTENGWLADAGSREALALGSSEPVVGQAVRHLLEPWLDESARAFQGVVTRHPLPVAGDQSTVAADPDECIVFADGLRYELGRSLAARLEARGCRVAMGHRWAALPTVTATGKPAVTPVADDVTGHRLGTDFRPIVHATDDSGQDQPATAQRLRDAMADRGYQIVGIAGAGAGSGDGTLGIPLSAEARGWQETGEIDKRGHHYDRHGASSFARLLDEELARLADEVTARLRAGWRSVRIVTDHGWLLLPGGLPLVTLPRHLTESKWARCAVIQPQATPDVSRFPWHWNPGESFATPPGVACFSKRPEYAHGGVSVQECLIPDIRVQLGTAPGPTATIVGVSWRRFRCDVEVRAAGGPVTVDLRLGSDTGESVASKPKQVDADGLASLVLADDEHENAALAVVATDADGRILAQQPTRRGA